VQFALNMAWTPLFFGLRLPLPALFDIVPLTGVTYTLAAVAYKVDPRTAIAFVPYCAWLSFATYLNGSFFSFFDVFLPLSRSSPRFFRSASIWWLNGGKSQVKDVKKDL
jgi:hypothetical protein